MDAESAVATRNFARIRKWAEQHHGKPAMVKCENGESKLEICFTEITGEKTSQEISWEEWFDIFRKNKLSFVYHEKSVNDPKSRDFRLVRNEHQL